MTTFSARMAALGTRMIAKFGSTVAWTQYVESPNPSSGSNPRVPTAGSPYSFTAGVLPIAEALIDGDTIQRGDLDCWLPSGLAFTPTSRDRCEFDGVSYQIVKVERFVTQNTTVAHRAVLRK